jgi:lipoyl-dependent peroxiredoxin
MTEAPDVLYTAEATVTGGREGYGGTSDGRLAVDLDVLKEMGGSGGPGTNPEQLFAIGSRPASRARCCGSPKGAI